mmetsp:Transcript_99034/g.154863  ORF Transcript_99034/g.154863 Transcript_99034/m.154863 type:complete len:118 (-) Transcript_99034:170-523(-)
MVRQINDIALSIQIDNEAKWMNKWKMLKQLKAMRMETSASEVRASTSRSCGSLALSAAGAISVNSHPRVGREGASTSCSRSSLLSKQSTQPQSKKMSRSGSTPDRRPRYWYNECPQI